MKFATVVVLAWAALGVATRCRAWDASENIIRLEGAVKGPLSDSFTLKLVENHRYTEKGSFHYYHHTELELGWAFAENWRLSPAFRYITARSKESDWISKPTWLLNLNNSASWRGLNLRTRLRLFHTDLDSVDAITDFRPKLTLQPTQGFTGWSIKPYIADELIYNFQDNSFYRNRFSGGVKLVPLKPLSFDLFLMQELTRLGSQNDWKERYNFGCSAAVYF
ncbi:hypothetical protein PDESU_04681 [Pontiella desulfatans]|uniref:Outer membrane protein beta-barrel domain-containing protein n=1 Tax=Pontiella desulfatans TaxID=2750659 RepID=A0A6C2U9A5_PONDE|nr:DUF2490 domain-containing protein [Pontiella desulfatans]VGO16091.1 hypothetical protein PDESU_04681 [Pontiella desulfatans]